MELFSDLTHDRLADDAFIDALIAACETATTARAGLIARDRACRAADILSCRAFAHRRNRRTARNRRVDVLLETAARRCDFRICPVGGNA